MEVNNIMRLYEHVAVSVVVSFTVYAITKSFIIAISSFLAGVFIDVDHLIDYWFEHPFRFDIVHFFKTCEEYHLKRVILIFHSIELLLFLGFLVYILREPLLLGITIGIAQHILFDQLFNRIYPFTYFFVYRFNQGFVNEKVFDVPKDIE